MTYSFDTLNSMWNGGKRAHPHIGKRLIPGLWFHFDDANNRFVITVVADAYVQNPDSRHWTKSPKEKWVMEPQVYVYPHRIDVLSKIQSYKLEKLFGLTWGKNSSNKELGQRWNYKNQTVVTEGLVSIIDDKLVVHEAPKIRTFNKKKQKAFNRKIKEVRRAFVVRAKLGLFDAGLSKEHVAILRDRGKPKNIYQCIECFDTEDVLTFFYLCAYITFATRYRFGQGWPKPSPPIAELFEIVLRQEREHIRRLLGVVSYV